MGGCVRTLFLLVAVALLLVKAPIAAAVCAVITVRAECMTTFDCWGLCWGWLPPMAVPCVAGAGAGRARGPADGGVAGRGGSTTAWPLPVAVKPMVASWPVPTAAATSASDCCATRLLLGSGFRSIAAWLAGGTVPARRGAKWTFVANFCDKRAAKEMRHTISRVPHDDHVVVIVAKRAHGATTSSSHLFYLRACGVGS